ncbi:MAG: preprotein translocase subunit SecE [Parcubacteria group bacterium]
MKLLSSFFSGVISEFKQITWPNRKETIKLVTVVIVFSLGMAMFLGLADYGFSKLLQEFILKI